MKIVLLRHATRSLHGLGDSPLNSTGRAQAEDLVNSIRPQGPLPLPTHLLMSPKLRAKQTLEPLGAHLEIPAKIDTRLDERQSSETVVEFEARIRDVIRDLSQLPDSGPNSGQQSSQEPCIYVCTHLDWLEFSLLLIPSDLTDREAEGSWPTAGYKVFEVQNGLWVFKSSGHIATRT